MRTVRRNKQRMKYALQIGMVEVVAKDAFGNPKTYTDSDGNTTYIYTGEQKMQYSKPVDIDVNIAFSSGEVEAKEYGLSVSDYDCSIVAERGLYPLTETSVLWFDSLVGKDKDGDTDPKTADFRVVAKKPSLNFDKFLLQRITK